MTYDEWESDVPRELKGDTLWRVEAYRLALFLCDLVWTDSAKLFRNPTTAGIADQLFRAAGKISASVAEGYSRDSGRARATFYEYALGSARECRDWYYKARRALSADVVSHRIDLTTQIARLTLKMTSTERRTNRRASD
jgi:four helix bundle protein